MPIPTRTPHHRPISPEAAAILREKVSGPGKTPGPETRPPFDQEWRADIVPHLAQQIGRLEFRKQGAQRAANAALTQYLEAEAELNIILRTVADAKDVPEAVSPERLSVNWQTNQLIVKAPAAAGPDPLHRAAAQLAAGANDTPSMP